MLIVSRITLTRLSPLHSLPAIATGPASVLILSRARLTPCQKDSENSEPSESYSNNSFPITSRWISEVPS